MNKIIELEERIKNLEEQHIMVVNCLYDVNTINKILTSNYIHFRKVVKKL